MKRPILSLILILAFAIFPGCGTSSKTEHTQEKTDLAGTIPVKRGQAFQIKLPVNPTGGYGWVYADPLDEHYLKELKREYTALPKEKATNTIAGFEAWTFQAIQKGETPIALVYKKHWRPDEMPVRTYNARVIIS